MLNRYSRMKNAKNPKERKKAMIRFVSLCSIFVVVFCVAIILSGCSFFKDSKRYEMKKSPCACFDKKA